MDTVKIFIIIIIIIISFFVTVYYLLEEGKKENPKQKGGFMGDRLDGAPRAKLILECVKRHIKGHQGKSDDDLKKMIRDHDAAIDGGAVKQVAKEVEPEVEEEEAEEEENLESDEEDVVEEDDGENGEEDDSKVSKKGDKKMAPQKTEVKAEKVEEKKEVKKSAKEKVVEKKEAKVEAKAEKKTAERGKKKVDKSALMTETGSPFRKDTSADVIWRVLKKGGDKGLSKEKIIEATKAYMDKHSIECGNIEGRFTRILTAINSGECGVKANVSKDEKEKYVLKIG